MTNGQTHSTAQTRTKWVLDLALFIGFLVAMEPRSTGIAIHERFTLAALGTILIHLLLNWDWLVLVTLRFFGQASGRSRLNYTLNWLLFIDGILLMLTGIMISEHVVPALGFSLPVGFAWRRLHDMSANLGLILLGFHTALHWGRIVNAFTSYVLRPIGRISSKRAARKDVAA